MTVDPNNIDGRTFVPEGLVIISHSDKGLNTKTNVFKQNFKLHSNVFMMLFKMPKPVMRFSFAPESLSWCSFFFVNAQLTVTWHRPQQQQGDN